MLRHKIVSVATSFAMLSVAFMLACSTDPQAEDGPELDISSPEALEDSLRDLEGKADQYLGVFYTSDYTNAILVGEDANGQPVVLIAGDHSKDYPYFHEDSEWDNILLLAGDRKLSLTDSSIDELTMTGLSGSGDTGTLTLNAQMIDESGRSASVSISLSLDVDRADQRFLGVRPLGLTWQPALLSLASGTITVDGNDVSPIYMHGLVEVGYMNNLIYETWATQYDALFLIPQASQGEIYVYVDISTRALSETVGKALNPLLERHARVSATFSQTGETQGNIHGIEVVERTDNRPLVFEDVADSGLARVHRQVVRFTDANGITLYGLRDVFDPK